MPRLRSTKALAAALLLLCAGPGLCLAADPVRVGVLEGYFPFHYIQEGVQTGFDVELARRACQLAGLDCEIVPIAAVADRIPALQNGTVDVLAAALVVTQERQQQVEFVHPFYYTSGTALAALADRAEAWQGGWEAIRGQPVCTVEGHYLNDFIAATYGPRLLALPTEADAVEALVAGDCIAAYTDSASLVFMHLGEQRHNASVAFVAGAPALDVQPYGLAVAKGNDALAIRLSGALAQGMMSAGNASAIFQLEQQYIVGNGGTEAPYLQDLTDALTRLVPPANN